MYVEYLRGLKFSFTDIASIMGISRATLYRRLDDAGIDCTCSYSRVSDRELDDEVRRIKHDHPNDGERLMMGHLVSRGVIVQRRPQLRMAYGRPSQTYKVEVCDTWGHRWVLENYHIFKVF